MRIGVSSGISNPPNAATFAEVVAGLGYNYTWAADFSSLSLSDFILPVTFDSVNYNADGIRIAHDASAASTTGRHVEVKEDILRVAAHSHSSADFPAGMMADTKTDAQVFGAIDEPENALGHGGRYVTVVATYHTMDLTDTPNFFTLELLVDAKIMYFLGNVNTGVYATPTILNGTEGLLSTQSEYDAVIDQVVLITHDLSNPKIYVNGDPGTDPSRVILNPARGKAANFDVTYHGIIFSDVPPSASLGFTLPVEISNPSI